MFQILGRSDKNCGRYRERYALRTDTHAHTHTHAREQEAILYLSTNDTTIYKAQ